MLALVLRLTLIVNLFVTPFSPRKNYIYRYLGYMIRYDKSMSTQRKEKKREPFSGPERKLVSK